MSRPTCSSGVFFALEMRGVWHPCGDMLLALNPSILWRSRFQNGEVSEIQTEETPEWIRTEFSVKPTSQWSLSLAPAPGDRRGHLLSHYSGLVAMWHKEKRGLVSCSNSGSQVSSLRCHTPLNVYAPPHHLGTVTKNILQRRRKVQLVRFPQASAQDVTLSSAPGLALSSFSKSSSEFAACHRNPVCNFFLSYWDALQMFLKHLSSWVQRPDITQST